MLTHYRTCHLCEAMCGLAIEVRGSEITSIRGDDLDPFSRGHVCPKAVALQDVQSDEDRLRRPVRRTSSGWERVSWDEAFDETAQRILAIQRRHGRDAVGLYVGNPTAHNAGALLFGGTLTRALRTRNRFSATSVDQLPHHVVSLLMYGHQLLLPIPDIDRTDFLLILGANPVVSNGSLMTAPDVTCRLKAIRARGGTIVVIDPRRSETADVASRHLFIRPGTDVLFLLAVLHTLFEEGRVDSGRLAGFADGLDEVARVATRYPPERVAQPTGIRADEIRALARAFAAAPAAVCYGRLGVSTQQFGAVAQWLVQVLNLVTGNLDRAGGAMFTRPAFDLVELMRRRGQQGHFATRRSRVRQLPNFGGEFPVAALAEEMLTPGDGQIRGLVTSAGNPVLSAPNGRQLDRALSGLDFMVAIDFYVNETTRHAHVILPPTFALEHEHYDVVFHVLAIRNTAKYSPPLFRPAADTRHDWEILLELATRISARDARSRVVGLARRALLRWLGPDGMLDLGLRRGPYGAGWNPFSRGLTLRKLKAAPHGIDLGPLEPCLPDRLCTPNRRIRLAPEALVADLARVEATLFGAADQPAAAENGFALIGRRDIRTNNSWMHNSERLVKGRDRCTMLMHPDDAMRLGLRNAQRVQVTSRVGRVEVPLETSDEMMPGVVSLPHGWGHDRPGARLRVAERHAGASVNDVTDEIELDALSGNAAFSGVKVQVEPAMPRR